MRHCRIKCLLFSAIVWATACSSPYKTLRPVTPDLQCIDRIRPQGIATSWFTAGIDVVGKHLSGLLFVKEMEDQSKRIVFTSETGLTLFDFEFKADGGFSLRQAIPQLRKDVVINTLKKDFETLLAIPFRGKDVNAWRTDQNFYFGVAKGKETYYFISDVGCTTLDRIEVGAKKPKFTIVSTGSAPREPETITIRHYTFKMTINLKKFNRDASE